LGKIEIKCFVNKDSLVPESGAFAIPTTASAVSKPLILTIVAVIASIAIISVSAATTLIGNGNKNECNELQIRSNITNQCGKIKY